MFSRYLMRSIVPIALIVGVQWYRDRAADPPAPLVDREAADQLAGASDDVRREWHALDDQSQRRADFAQFEARQVEALLRKELGLGDVTERVFYYALQNYPEFLEYVHNAEHAQHIKTKVAKNLLRTLEMRRDMGRDDSAILAHYECELDGLPYEGEAGTQPVRQ